MTKDAAPRWPKIHLSIQIGGGGNVAESLGLSPRVQRATLAWSGEQIEALMNKFGWEEVASKEIDRAVWSLEEIMERALEDCAWKSGYSMSQGFNLKESLQHSDPFWRLGLCGQRPTPQENDEAAQVRSTLNMEVPMEIRMGPGSDALKGALLRTLRDECSAKLISTLMDLFERIGARPTIVKAQGLGPAELGVGPLPDWSWPKRGAALVVERPDGSAVCARISPAGIRAVANSALGRAFGPQSAFALLSSTRALRLVLTQGIGSRSYRRCALSQNREEHFPMVVWTARSSWHEEVEAAPEEIEKALRSAGLGPRGISRIDVAPSADKNDPGSFESPAVGKWIAGLEANLLADKLAKSLTKAVPAQGLRRRL